MMLGTPNAQHRWGANRVAFTRVLRIEFVKGPDVFEIRGRRVGLRHYSSKREARLLNGGNSHDYHGARRGFLFWHHGGVRWTRTGGPLEAVS